MVLLEKYVPFNGGRPFSFIVSLSTEFPLFRTSLIPSAATRYVLLAFPNSFVDDSVYSTRRFF